MKLQKMMAQLKVEEVKPAKPHQFWDKQPLSKDDQEGFIIDPADSQFAQSAILPAGFTWCSVDIQDKDQLEDLYNLLRLHYVEDPRGSFRLLYSKEILRWALVHSPKDLLLGVRVEKSGRLVAFISATLLKLRIYDNVIPSASVNFLCVHRKLREKRLAPQLIREITSRLYGHCQLALFTSGVRLDEPVSSVGFFNRPLNYRSLVATGYMMVPMGETIEDGEREFSLGRSVSLAGWRRMEERDLSAVHALLTAKLEPCTLAPVYSEAELRHLLLGCPEGVQVYVVETEGQVTEFVSWFTIESQVLNMGSHCIRQAQLLYHGGEREEQLLRDAMITARNEGYDVFNVTNIMDRTKLLRSFNFCTSVGLLHYYLFNYRMPTIAPEHIGLAMI